jgi:hypothetical protein
MIGSLAMIALAALTGLGLGWAPVALLALHLAGAAGGAGLLAAFLARHWWPRRETIRRHPNSLLGYLAVSALALLAVSGAVLLWATNAAPLRQLHNVATFALLAVLATHGLWRIVRRLPHPAAEHRRRARLTPWPAVVLLAAGLVALAALPGAASKTASPAPSIGAPIGHAALGTHELPAAARCAECHADAAAQWRTSLHAQAGTNAYYQAVTALFIQERGIDAAHYCAACHNPVGLLRGEVSAQAAVSNAQPASGKSATHKAYEARALGIHLPMSDAAAEGVTCAVCHVAAAAGEPPNNGNLTLHPDRATLPADSFGRLALRSAPSDHRAQVLPAVISDAALCGACHNVYTETGVPLEPTYDEWLASPYPAEGKTCQSCHMPVVQARRADSGLPQPVAAHGSIPGVLSSLPGVAQDPTLLQQAAELRLDLERGAAWQVVVRVTNRGAGHKLPTGAADLRQVWLEVTLRDAAGRVVQQHGGVDRFGMLTPETVQFRKVLGDAQGRPIDLHRFWVATQILADTRLAPRETRRIAFRFAAPPTAEGPYTIEARLLYRDVAPAFAEFALNQPMPDLPAHEMAAQRMSVGGVR